MANKNDKKKVRDPKLVLLSLLNLKRELLAKRDEHAIYLEMLLKVNSCLFSGYPVSATEKGSDQ